MKNEMFREWDTTNKENVFYISKRRTYVASDLVTKRNNNVALIGSPGSAKTTTAIEPNILLSDCDNCIVETKHTLYERYKNIAEAEGKMVVLIDFKDPKHSMHYNPFCYMHGVADVRKMAHLLAYPNKKRGSSYDPFWDEEAENLFTACALYLLETQKEKGVTPTLGNLIRLIDLLCERSEEPLMVLNVQGRRPCKLDSLFDELACENPDSDAVKFYKKVMTAPEKTYSTIVATSHAKIGLYDIPEIKEMMSYDDLHIETLGEKPVDIYVETSELDRSLDNLVNLFITQITESICARAETYEDKRLPRRMNFIFDDFGTNVTIDNFEKMITSVRSRNVSYILAIQSKCQLNEAYGDSADTILGCCDTVAYFGGNDLSTMKDIAARVDKPDDEIIRMPAGKVWVYRRGERPKLDEWTCQPGDMARLAKELEEKQMTKDDASV